MSRRRLTGIAAMSAVTLATAGIGGSTFAAEEPDGVAELRALMEAFGGGEVPDEALVQMLAMYESMGIDPAQIFGVIDPELIATLGASGLAFPKLEDPGESGELYPQTDVFMELFSDAASGEGLDEDAFLKLIFEGAGIGEAAFPKVEDLLGGELDEDAFLKLGDAGDEAFLKLGAPLAVAEAALAAAAAQGDIDPATLQSILDLLPEE